MSAARASRAADSRWWDEDDPSYDYCPFCGPLRLTVRAGRVEAVRLSDGDACVCSPAMRLAVPERRRES